MPNRLLLFGLTFVAGACASSRVVRPEVRVRVTSAAHYTMSVRTCPPGPCSDFRQLRPGATTTFSFPWNGYSRHIVEGRDGDRVVIRVPLDFEGPGRQTVTLDPRHHPQEPPR